ncbi:hypothetical protein [Streptomyces zaomyceticus]|uniref:hypothetical protein n=1 Tax=Streptomyces zaomyceticus TaxID=68286 RepID=UPI003423CE02
MSLRRLRVLVEYLPSESATKTALRNALPEGGEPVGDYRPDKAPWSSTEMLLADIKDQLVLSRMVAIAAAGGKPGDFKPTPRPGIPPTASGGRRRLTDEQRAALDPRLRTQPKEA